MAQEPGDTAFVGSIPEMYERLMVPLIFAEPAEHLVRTIAARRPSDVLETASGTGVVTRLLDALEPAPRIVATDLNAPMLAAAERLAASARITWQVADALDLPFDPESFDVVTCQFGAMFFPDRVAGYREALRVLRPGGAFVFNVWDEISTNAVADVVTSALRGSPPPLDFLARTPHGHSDAAVIISELTEAGFAEVQISHLDGVSRCTPRVGAVAYCQGTPLRGEIERHPSLSVESATTLAEAALREQYGDAEFDAPTRWLEVVASRPV